jgi:hypothetical protein
MGLDEIDDGIGHFDAPEVPLMFASGHANHTRIMALVRHKAIQLLGLPVIHQPIGIATSISRSGLFGW